MRRFYKLFGSLKIAVVVLVGLVGALTVGTVLESQYDAPTAKYYIYGARWFQAVLVLFAINIFCAAMTRWPWQKKHTAFLLAHAGILLVLAGAFLTDRYGIDGSLILTEGQTSGFVELSENVLVVRDPARPALLPIPWRPANRGSFQLSFPEYDFSIAEWIAHAERVPAFESDPIGGRPMVALEVGGGPLGATQAVWIHARSAQDSRLSLGPAEIVILPTGMPFSVNVKAARLEFQISKNEIAYRAFSAREPMTHGKFKKGEAGEVKVPWSMGAMRTVLGFRKPIKVTLKSWEFAARDVSTYVPSRVQYGDQAPPPAVLLKNSRGDSVWLGFSERRMLALKGGPTELEFMPRFSILPFALKLDRFEISRYEGTADPSAYRSHVRVESETGLADPVQISMNEPLQFGGFTFYQASFIPGQPRPTTTVLSVNRDPGRPFKYWGSVVMVLGAILLFARKYKKLANRDLFPS